MEWHNCRCLVTGGAGFIGSNLVSELLKKGSEVTLIDDLSTGSENKFKEQISMGVNGVKGSILDSNLLKKKVEKVDYIFHLAALPSISESISSPLSTSDVNLHGTLNVLEAARNSEVRKVVFTSSCAIYGSNSEIPLSENAIPMPLSPYAVQKLSAEYFCKLYNDIYGVPTTTLRLFNVYGPGQSTSSEYSAVIPKFISSLISKKRIEIYGDGFQSRDFVYVDDVIQSILKSVERPGSDGMQINIASGKNISINEISKLITKFLDSDIKPLYKEQKIGEIRHSLADIAKAKELIGYYPNYTLEDGVLETINSYLKR